MNSEYTNRKLIQKFIIPAAEGKAFVVKKGQLLRIVALEGKQVADIIFFNANDYKEVFNTSMTVVFNEIQGIGNRKKVKELYSKPPRENVMLTVLEDKVGCHYVDNGGRCSKRLYEFRNQPGHKNCQDILSEAIAPYGLTPDDVPDVFNLWMNVDIEDDMQVFKPSLASRGDYLDLMAEMDVLVGASACPSEGIVNHGKPKPLGIEIYEMVPA